MDSDTALSGSFGWVLAMSQVGLGIHNSLLFSAFRVQSLSIMLKQLRFSFSSI